MLRAAYASAAGRLRRMSGIACGTTRPTGGCQAGGPWKRRGRGNWQRCQHCWRSEVWCPRS
eukprot:8831391-Alexandrium_andersonii.AAC.1